MTTPFSPKPNQTKPELYYQKKKSLTAVYEVLTPGEENSKHQWKCWKS